MTGTPASRPRSAGVDLVRALGICAIVVAHVRPTRHVFYTWHVPVFFVLTGYLWRDGRALSDEVLRRVRSLLVPYVSWLLLGVAGWYLYLRHAGHPEQLNPTRTLVLGGWYLKSPFVAYWFVTALFVAAVVVRLLAPLSWWGRWAVGAGALAWAVHDPAAVRSTALGWGIGLVGVVFVSAGVLLRDLLRRAPQLSLLGLPLLAGSWLLGWSGVLRPLDLKAADVGTPWLSAVMAVGISWGLVLVLEQASSRLPAAVLAAGGVVARYGLAVILGHSFVLTVVWRHHLAPAWWMPVVALSVSLAVAWCVDRTPLRRLLLGTSGAPARRDARTTPSGATVGARP